MFDMFCPLVEQRGADWHNLDNAARANTMMFRQA